MKRILTLTVAAVAIAASATAALATDITGAGSTFAFPILSKWADAYKSANNVGLNYQSIGSGGGIKQIKAKTVTFGATDAPLTGDDLKASGLVQFPIIMGGIVPVVNIKGVEAGQMVLDGPTLANIYLGTITKWNDPAIAKLNPSLKLPDEAISVVERSDGSGTTFNLTYYLADVSADWKSKVGVDKSVQWPVGMGAKGNEGVAAGVMQADGSIGYVEYAYAKQNKMAFTKMVNKDGKTVAPEMAAFEAAAKSAKWDSVPGMGVIIANQAGATTWPMTASTWALVYAQPDDAAATGEALKFFDWAFKKGQKQAAELDYVALPDAVVGDIEKMWAANIKSKDGKSLFAGN
jgi:phosphate transport system substrate-binding protein